MMEVQFGIHPQLHRNLTAQLLVVPLLLPVFHHLVLSPAMQLIDHTVWHCSCN